MYGTVARLHLKPGMEEQFIAWGETQQIVNIPGHISAYVYRMDTEPNVYYLAVAFESQEAYVANATSPEQDARYRAMLALLEGAPEWHDGEIVAAFPPT